MKKAVIAGIGMMGMLVTGHAEKVDILKPEYQRKEQASRRFIESLRDNPVPYTIQAQKYRQRLDTGAGFFSSPRSVEADEYIITFPKETQDQLDRLDKKVLMEMCMDYLYDDRYAFPVMVLMMAEASPFRTHRPGNHFARSLLPVFLQKDMTLWHPPSQRERSDFADAYDSSIFYSSIREKKKQLLDTQDYAYSVFHESIPKASYDTLLNTRDSIWKTYATERHHADVQTFSDVLKMPYQSSECPTMVFTRRPAFSSGGVEIFSREQEMREKDTQRLLKICRENDPSAKPYLPALMMGLFTVDGYGFNDETGVYTLNERGRMLMDFIVEFPIPENATRLQAVMNGGNKDEIQAMMKKHNTTEKWAELLKNPVHPDFAKYPQD